MAKATQAYGLSKICAKLERIETTLCDCIESGKSGKSIAVMTKPVEKRSDFTNLVRVDTVSLKTIAVVTRYTVSQLPSGYWVVVDEKFKNILSEHSSRSDALDSREALVKKALSKS